MHNSRVMRSGRLPPRLQGKTWEARLKCVIESKSLSGASERHMCKKVNKIKSTVETPRSWRCQEHRTSAKEICRQCAELAQKEAMTTVTGKAIGTTAKVLWNSYFTSMCHRC